MKTRIETATERFLSGYNCAQSVLETYAPELGLEVEPALKAACGFGAGMGRKGEVCGAVTGGIMAIGLRYGRGARDGREVTEQTYAKTVELMRRFEQLHGSCLCRVLIEGCDLQTPEGQRYFKEHDLLRQRCVGCVQSVVGMLGDLLAPPPISDAAKPAA